MAAIGKACLLAYVVEVVVGEQQIFFGFIYPHTLDIFFTAHAVLLPEFGGKAGIAHVAFLGDICDPDIVLKTAVDILGDIFDAEYLLRPDRAAADIEPFIYPQPEHTVYQAVDMGTQHDISAKEKACGLADAVSEYLTAAKFIGKGGAEMYAHTVGAGIAENIAYARCIGGRIREFARVELYAYKVRY